MSRGHDGLDFDDFRGSTGGFDRDESLGSSSGENSWMALQNIHQEEDRADYRDRISRERPALERPAVPREKRLRSSDAAEQALGTGQFGGCPAVQWLAIGKQSDADSVAVIVRKRSRILARTYRRASWLRLLNPNGPRFFLASFVSG